MVSSTVISIPSDEKEFERNCIPLFVAELSDPNVKLVATRGKSQNGLDLIGKRDRDPNQVVGIQCKLKTKAAKLSEADVQTEISKALKFQPPLSEYVIVTTASDDLEYDKIAVSASQAQKKAGRQIDIQIWGWDTLQTKIHKDKKTLDAFDPNHSESTDSLIDLGKEALETSDRGHKQTHAEMSNQTVILREIQATITQTADTQRGDELNSHVDNQIDDIRELLTKGKPRTALELFEKLEEKISEKQNSAIRARIKANIGIANLHLGNEEKAGNLLLQAYEINPDDPKVRVNRILGFQLLGKFDEAISWSASCLRDDPTNHMIASYIFQTATLIEDAPDPLKIIPTELLEHTDVRIYHMHFLRTKNKNSEWHDLAIETLAQAPEDKNVVRIAADAYLDMALGPEGLKISQGMSQERSSYLNLAAELYAQFWKECADYENVNQTPYSAAACNYITALRVLGDIDTATIIKDNLIALDTLDAKTILCCAHVALDKGDYDEALELIEKVETSDEAEMLRLQALVNKGDWQGLIEHAEKIDQSTYTVESQQEIDAIILRAETALHGEAELDERVDSLIEKWPDSAIVLIAVSDLYRSKNDRKFEEFFQLAVSQVDNNSHFGIRRMLAELAMFAEKWSVVIDLLIDHVSIDRVTSPLGWLAVSFANAPPTKRASQFFKSLPDEIINSARFARLAGAAEHNRGNVQLAIKYLSIAITDDPSDLRAHLLLHSSYVRSNDTDAAADLIRALDESGMDGDALDKMRLALLLRNHREAERALEYGYQVASQSRDIREVVVLYPGLIFADDKLPTWIGTSGKAQEDQFFHLEGQDGEKDIQGLITNIPTDGVSHYPLSNKFAQLLLGKEVGDEVELSQEVGTARKYIIKELKHKFIWLLHDIMEAHPTKFPDEKSMFSMTMKDDDVQPLLDYVRKFDDSGNELIRIYRDQSIPLGAIAAISNKHVITMANHLALTKEKLRTCVGLKDEMDRARTLAFRARSSGVVLDTLTIWRAQQFGVLEAIKEWFGNIFIAQSTFDDLLEMKAEAKSHAGRDYSTISHLKDGKFELQEFTVKETTDAVNFIAEAVKNIQSQCQILPVDRSDEPEFNEDLENLSAGALFDPIFLARKQNYAFLSDERELRLTAEAFGVKSTFWLQIVLKLLEKHETLPRNDYLRATAKLAAFGHSFLALNAIELIDLLTLDFPQSEQLFKIAIEYIGGGTADPISHANVAVGFMVQIWGTRLSSWSKGSAIGGLLTNLIRDRADWEQILQYVYSELLRGVKVRQYGAQESLEYLRGWITGHFYSVQGITR